MVCLNSSATIFFYEKLNQLEIPVTTIHYSTRVNSGMAVHCMEYNFQSLRYHFYQCFHAIETCKHIYSSEYNRFIQTIHKPSSFPVKIFQEPLVCFSATASLSASGSFAKITRQLFSSAVFIAKVLIQRYFSLWMFWKLNDCAICQVIFMEWSIS